MSDYVEAIVNRLQPLLAEELAKIEAEERTALSAENSRLRAEAEAIAQHRDICDAAVKQRDARIAQLEQAVAGPQRRSGRASSPMTRPITPQNWAEVAEELLSAATPGDWWAQLDWAPYAVLAGAQVVVTPARSSLAETIPANLKLIAAIHPLLASARHERGELLKELNACAVRIAELGRRVSELEQELEFVRRGGRR